MRNDSEQQKSLLSVCLNDSIRHTRHLLLQNAGYEVESVLNVRDLRSACKRRKFDLVIVCHSLDSRAKQFLGANMWLLCRNTPVLELCIVSPEMKTGHHLINPSPEALLESVESIVGVAFSDERRKRQTGSS